jgi:hypothetical protein
VDNRLWPSGRGSAHWKSTDADPRRCPAKAKRLGNLQFGGPRSLQTSGKADNCKCEKVPKNSGKQKIKMHAMFQEHLSTNISYQTHRKDMSN